MNYKIEIPYTDPLWTVCEAADGADLPTQPPLSSCDCVDANITLANNDTTLACNCSFALMEKCSKFEYSFKLMNVKLHEDDHDEVKLSANCDCDLFILEKLIPNEQSHSNLSNLHNSTQHQPNNSSSTGQSNSTHPYLTNTTVHGLNQSTHTTKPPFTIARSLKGNCSCIVPALNKTNIETEWWNRNWTFPDNWNYTLNNTFPKMEYTFDDAVDMEKIIDDGRSVMKYIYGSSFSSKPLFPVQMTF